MKIKFFIPAVLLIAIVCLLPGCGSEPEAVIFSERNGWSPAMSSIPGLPLQAVVKTDLAAGDLRYHWTAEEGTFLIWHDGKIDILGKNTVTHEEKIYWALGTAGKIEGSLVKIHVIIEDGASITKIAEAEARIMEKIGICFLFSHTIS